MGCISFQTAERERPAEIHRTLQAVGCENQDGFYPSQDSGRGFPCRYDRCLERKYYRTLTVYLAQLHKLGVLYNQAVRTLNSYHSVVVAKTLTEKLERLSQKINANMEEVIRLTKERQ